MSTSGNSPMFPPGIVHPSLRQRPPTGISEEELTWSVRRYGQFKNVQEPSHSFPGSGYVTPDVSPLLHESQLGRRPQKNAWDGTYNFRQAGTGQLPLQPMQPLVAPMQWQDFLGHQTRFYYPQPRSQPLEHHAPAQHYGPRYSDVLQNSGASQPAPRGQPPRRGQSQSFRGSQRSRGFPLPNAPPRLAFVPPDLEKTPIQKLPNPSTQRPRTQQLNKENYVQPVHVWKDSSEAPQSSGKYVPPPLPPIDLDLVVEVGDIVRIKPWVDQYTWIEGRVEKADFSVIKNYKPYPRYLVSYTDPASKHLKQRTFCPHLSEIMVKEPDEPGSQPLPEGIDRNIYACIPGLPVVESGVPIEMTWAHARVLTPPDEDDRINIRVLVGPSKNLLFDKFPIKYTLPFCRASRARVTKLGYAVAGNDEHPIDEI
ncbi:hypothetical protein B0H19DRAFT_1275977 [Mycena capillaripes]|nr:hypothetical protein B0H19DRAFT_1275977 [Mycena capillaripes]